MQLFDKKLRSSTITQVIALLMLSTLLLSCGGLSPSSGGVSSGASASSSKQKAAATNLDVVNSSSNHTIRMAWEGAIEQSRVRNGYSVEADKRGDMGVFCFANETDCRKAHSDIRNTVIGGAAYRDNPVAVQALELQFKPSITSNFTISMLTARPVMKATTNNIETASRSELWFTDFRVLTYTYANGTGTLTASNTGSIACGGDTSFGVIPSTTDIYKVVADNPAESYDIYRGPRVLTGLGLIDSGVKQTGTDQNIYYYGRFGWANIHHVGMAPAAEGGKFDPTFIPTTISSGQSTTPPTVVMGEGKNYNPVHQVGWKFYSGAKPVKWHQHLVVGLCIKDSPLIGAFFRTNLFSLRDCSLESCK